MLIRSHSEELRLSIEGKGVNGLDFHVPSLPHIVDFFNVTTSMESLEKVR